MTTADLTLVVIILIGAISGYRQGFLMELFSFAALLLGILGAFKLLGYAMIFLDDQFNISKTILPYVAFAAVFIAIVISVRLIGKLIKMSIDKTLLGSLDKAAGAVLGLLKASFLLSVALWIVHSLNLQLPSAWTTDSWLLPRVESFAPQVAVWLGQYVPFFRDIFT
ncbi:MAG TPA: CvpA family protein [Chryseosolibacter sp.]|nr:CvpA family protein [Chryseosolibacter sp.]